MPPKSLNVYPSKVRLRNLKLAGHCILNVNGWARNGTSDRLIPVIIQWWVWVKSHSSYVTSDMTQYCLLTGNFCSFTYDLITTSY